MASLAFLLDAQQQGQANSELIVRLLDVSQGDATYLTNGASRVIIDGGPSTATFGRYLDSLNLNNSTIDVVILSHQHLDHYSGLRELFRTSRHIHVRYFFENKDPAPAVTLAILRDSILSRMDHDSLVYRDTDDPDISSAIVLRFPRHLLLRAIQHLFLRFRIGLDDQHRLPFFSLVRHR